MALDDKEKKKTNKVNNFKKMKIRGKKIILHISRSYEF